MNNVEVEQIVTDRYAYMNVKTFKEFLKLYPLDNSYEWAGMLLKWLVYRDVAEWNTMKEFLSNPWRIAFKDGDFHMYPDPDVLDFVPGGENDKVCLVYSVWDNREGTLCWVNWRGDSARKVWDADRSNPETWERAYHTLVWMCWFTGDNGNVGGSEVLGAYHSLRYVLECIIEFTVRRLDKFEKGQKEL